ncbi:MAG: 4,5-dihydroxyphthalate decarboxylase [Acidimicrobiales bacterium]
MTVTLTMAMSEYDHVRDLASGRVRAEGVELTVLRLPVEEIFYRFLRHREWHVSELSLAKYVALRAGGDDSLSAIPVFPSRVCRHSSIFVRPDGPSHPKELSGARVGVPEWAQTASVYTRSLLVHEWGIPLSDVQWFQAGVNQAGRREKVDVHLPDGVSLTTVQDRTLDSMLRDGQLDAVFSAHPPASFERGDPGIVRLFEDYEPVEREYVARTGIFPIMHVVAIRADVLAGAPWVAQNLLDAFEAAKQRSLERMSEMTASRVPLPWGPSRLAEACRLLGPDPWPYGVAANRITLEAFTRFAHEQGVAARRLDPEELFAPQVLGDYRV